MKKIFPLRGQPARSMALIITCILFILFVSGGFIGVKVFQFYKKISTPAAKPGQGKDSIPVEQDYDYALLLAGYGGGTHDGTYLTDTLMIIRFDTQKKRALLISLPRDIWVRIPTKDGSDFHEKINAVYQMGLFPARYPAVAVDSSGTQAGALLKEVVSGVVGFPIDSYAAISFDGFIRAVDMLGGVDIDVKKTFDDYEYPITGEEDNLCEGRDESMLPNLLLTVTVSPREAFPCRYEHLHFDAGMTHMDGVTALKFVRSRHSLQDGTDFGRAARQQLLLQAVREKVISVGFLPKIIPLMDELSSYIRTDIPLSDIQRFLPELTAGDSYETASLIPTDEQFLTPSRSSYGGYILIPENGIDEWKPFQEEIRRVFAGEIVSSESAILNP